MGSDRSATTTSIAMAHAPSIGGNWLVLPVISVARMSPVTGACTDAVKKAIEETERRRAVQEAYNAEHGITPASIIKNIDDVLSSVYERDYLTIPKAPDEREQFKTQAELDAFLVHMERQMRDAAANLEFERAASLRDRLRKLRNPELVAPVNERQ